jgi:DNA-binding transcriptional ArsR family regulator
MLPLRVLADPTRQRIVELLATGPKSSGDIAQHFEVSAPAISQHLKALREARLVRVQVQAQRRIYQLDPAGVEELAAWVTKIRSFWSARLDALEAQLQRGDLPR